jgi:hypothetical protein
MTTWDLFIFVAGPCFVSSLLCPNHRYNLCCLSHRIVYFDTIVLSFLIFHHHFISLAHLIIHARALTQQRQFSVQLLESEGSRTSTVDVKTVARHRIADQTISVLTLTSPARRPRHFRLDGDLHLWTNDFLVASPCISSAYVVSSI